MTKQIIGKNLDLAFQELPISGKKVYESKREGKHPFQVWELTDGEYEMLNFIEEDDWEEHHGWWRYGECSQEPAFTIFTVNGKKMIGFKQNNDYPNSLPFHSFSDWFENYMNLSKETNLALFAHSLAKYNSMTLADFMRDFEG